MTYQDNKLSKLFDSKEGYNIWAKKYDEYLKYLDSFEQDKLMKLIGDIKGKKVLDMGCGTGRIIPNLLEKGGEVIAADISEEMLKIVNKKHHQVKTVICDICALPFPNELFDMVIASFVIVHLKDLKTAFDEIYRVLKNGGIFIVTNINQRKAPKLKLDSKKEIIIKSYYHIPKQVLEALNEAAFSIDKEEYIYEGDVWINQLIKATK